MEEEMKIKNSPTLVEAPRIYSITIFILHITSLINYSLIFIVLIGQLLRPLNGCRGGPSMKIYKNSKYITYY